MWHVVYGLEPSPIRMEDEKAQKVLQLAPNQTNEDAPKNFSRCLCGSCADHLPPSLIQITCASNAGTSGPITSDLKENSNSSSAYGERTVRVSRLGTPQDFATESPTEFFRDRAPNVQRKVQR
jgi:hypothetical protein